MSFTYSLLRLAGLATVAAASGDARKDAPSLAFNPAVQEAAVPQDAALTVLLVNGREISGREFRWFMEQERAEVLHYFKRQYDLEDGTNFWSQEVGGITPKAMLQSNTVARVVREKVEQLLFQELGLVKDIGYAALLAQLERLNREREQAARQGRAVYGPVRYTQLQFYEHWKATLRTRARDQLAENIWRPTEDGLRKFYFENRTRFQALPRWTLEVVTVHPRKNLAAGERAGAVRLAADSILGKFRAGAALSAVLEEPPEGAAVEVSGQRMEEVNADRLGEMFPGEEHLKAVLALGLGETGLLAGPDGQAWVVRCLGKAAGGVRPYEAVERQVRDLWLTQQYDRHIERLALQAKVQINQETLDALFR